MALKSGVNNVSAILSAVLLLALAACYIFIPGVRQTVNEGWHLLLSGDNDAISEWFREFGFWGPLIIIIARVMQKFLIILSSWGLMIVAVIAYGHCSAHAFHCLVWKERRPSEIMLVYPGGESACSFICSTFSSTEKSETNVGQFSPRSSMSRRLCHFAVSSRSGRPLITVSI